MEYFDIPVKTFVRAVKEFEFLDEALAEDEVVTVSEEFIKELLQIMGDFDFFSCDHSVGICSCSAIDVANDIQLAMEGKQICTECMGDGWTEHPNFDPGTCFVCNGEGKVLIGE